MAYTNEEIKLMNDVLGKLHEYEKVINDK